MTTTNPRFLDQVTRKIINGHRIKLYHWSDGKQTEVEHQARIASKVKPKSPDLPKEVVITHIRGEPLKEPLVRPIARVGFKRNGKYPVTDRSGDLWTAEKREDGKWYAA